MNLRELGSKLTPDERLKVWRRRKNWSQTKAALHFGVSMRIYTAWENGQRSRDVPTVEVYPLRDHEVCWLYRKRSKESRALTAQNLGVTPYWISRLERGREQNVDILLGYWES